VRIKAPMILFRTPQICIFGVNYMVLCEGCRGDFVFSGILNIFFPSGWSWLANFSLAGCKALVLASRTQGVTNADTSELLAGERVAEGFVNVSKRWFRSLLAT